MFEMYKFVDYRKRFCRDYLYFLSQECPTRLVAQEEIEKALKQDELFIESLRNELNKENVKVLNQLLVKYDCVKNTEAWKSIKDAHEKLEMFSKIREEYFNHKQSSFKKEAIQLKQLVLDEIEDIIDEKFVSKYESLIENNEHYGFYIEYFDTIDKYYDDACRLYLIRKTMLEMEKLQVFCKEHPELIKNKKNLFKKK